MAMKRNCSKLISLCLVLCMMLSLAVCASAAEIDTSGGSGTTPVSLTTTNGGIGGGDDGDITPTKLNVTVPTTLPLAMSDEGTDHKLLLWRGAREIRHDLGGGKLASYKVR